MYVVKEIKNHGSTKVSIIRDKGNFYIKKELTIDKYPFRELFNQEIKMTKSLNHKNIISIKEVQDNYFTMEYGDLGDLKELLKTKTDRVISKREYYLSRILEGIQYMHTRNVIHNDLKLSNIFITKNDKVKIGDFGLSCIEGSKFFEKLPSYIFKGTFSLNKKDNNQTSNKEGDIYSLGVMLFELYTLKDPAFNNLDPNLIENKKNQELFMDMISESPPTITQIIKRFKDGKKNIF